MTCAFCWKTDAISKLQHHLTTADMQQLIDCLNEMERLHAQKNLRAYTDMDSEAARAAD